MTPFEFVEPPRVDGEWVPMRELAKLGEAIVVADGYLTDDDENQYKGQTAPRYIVAGTVKTTGDAIKVSCPKGYSRDDKFRQLREYLTENPAETVAIRFVNLPGTAYIDVVLAD